VELRARPLRDAVDALARRARLVLGTGAPSASVLTPREQEVMPLVAQGLTNRQIGRRLFISEKTASVHDRRLDACGAGLGAGLEGRVAFYDDRVDVIVDGVPRKRARPF
jgi:DNA-binding CsgD family transcriptional regulator